jgi:hypothetical protein
MQVRVWPHKKVIKVSFMVCSLVVSITSGEENPDLSPEVRDVQFQSAVDLLKLFGIF